MTETSERSGVIQDSWHREAPPSQGYYIAAWMHLGDPRVGALLYEQNPPRWWLCDATSAIVDSEPVDTVFAWQPMPAPPPAPPPAPEFSPILDPGPSRVSIDAVIGDPLARHLGVIGRPLDSFVADGVLRIPALDPVGSFRFVEEFDTGEVISVETPVHLFRGSRTTPIEYLCGPVLDGEGCTRLPRAATCVACLAFYSDRIRTATALVVQCWDRVCNKVIGEPVAVGLDNVGDLHRAIDELRKLVPERPRVTDQFTP